MVQNAEVAEIVNDLVEINNDRIVGYQRALGEVKAGDEDLKVLFLDMVNQSQQYKQELSNIVRQLGDEPEQGTRMEGKIYRAWMDIKATFSGNSRKSVLDNCEFGEDAALRAYKTALTDEHLPPAIMQILNKQQQALLSSHNKIKQLRDQAKQ
jgi:uncharacterized protein (TIGR02284 family)